MESNIFKALKMAQDEVLMCRFLADLLDPKGHKSAENKLDTSFLKSFLEVCLQMDCAKLKNLERTCVMAEYLIDNGRRIDIMLQHPQFSIPIEAKINAGDQESQCYDYHFYARNAKLVYLTKDDKTKPSPWTMQSRDKGNTLEESAVTCISWKSICTWLEERREKQLKSDQNAELLAQVRQYIGAIEWFLSNPKKQSADGSLACTVLEAFKEAIDRKAIAETYQLEWLEDSYKSYCSAELKEKKKTNLQCLNFCPGVNYKVKTEGLEFSDSSQEMWFRIEASDDGYLVGGFCLVEKKRENDWMQVKVDDAAMETVKKQFPAFRVIASRSNWWFVWRYSNGKQAVSYDDVPNFKTMNQCAMDLRDPVKLKEFVEETLQIFEEQLLQYLKSPPEL